ncbi:MAG: hypothetical protein ACFFBC_00295 [Promethearchaeota archaeon]
MLFNKVINGMIPATPLQIRSKNLVGLDSSSNTTTKRQKSRVNGRNHR